MGLEVEALDGFDYREPRILDAALGGFALPLDQLTLRQTQKVDRLIVTVLGGDGRHPGIVTHDGR